MPAPIIPLRPSAPRVAEFFAGVGLARAGLERAGFEAKWANDLEAFKYEMYSGNFTQTPDSEHTFVLGDVTKVSGSSLPDVDLAWSSFPCTDLSLAGSRAGLSGGQSSTFFQFTRVLREMKEEGRLPPVVALENVTALASSRGGDDLTAALRELNDIGYSVDVLAIDARRFVPQSRPRLFIVGAINPPMDSPEPNSELRPDWLQAFFGDKSLRTHRAPLPAPPAPLTSGLSEYIEVMDANDPRWWDRGREQKFLDSLSSIQKSRLADLVNSPQASYRTAYRRTRKGSPVWEIRADDVSGCLRTARGGSSKQAVVRAGNGQIDIRWMTALEYARLMGAGDYNLDGLRPSQIIFGFGDAVCVDAVAWLGENYLSPLLRGELSDQHRNEASIGQSRNSLLQRA